MKLTIKYDNGSNDIYYPLRAEGRQVNGRKMLYFETYYDSPEGGMYIAEDVIETWQLES